MTEAPERGGGGRIDVVLSRLKRVRPKAGGGFTALCPAHEDKDPSLTVAEGRRGIVFTCWSGCQVNEIRLALDLTWPELFYDGIEEDGKPPPIDRRGQALEALAAAARLVDEPDAVAELCRRRGWSRKALASLGVGWDGERLTIPISDEKGRAHDVLRYAPDSSKFKILAGKGRSRYPFPAPELVETAGRTRGLCLVEGEGTALSLASVGLPVVALPGAVARATGDVHRPGHFEGVGWHKAWARRFRKFGRVWLFPDADDVGRNLMRTVAYDLQNDGAGIRPILADLGGPKGYDLGDFLAPARTLAARRQGRDLILGLAATATRQVELLDEMRQLMFAWNGSLLGTEGAEPIPPPAEIVPPELEPPSAGDEIAWV